MQYGRKGILVATGRPGRERTPAAGVIAIDVAAAPIARAYSRITTVGGAAAASVRRRDNRLNVVRR